MLVSANSTIPHRELTQSSRVSLTCLNEVSACRGVTPDSSPDIDLVLIRCGFLLSPPTRIVNVSENFHQSQSLYACASTVRATVKEVSLQYKQAADWPSLSDLSVSHISPKKYPNDTSKPLWAVEKLENKWTVSSIRPLWGIADSIASENLHNLWTIQSESFFLPDYEGVNHYEMDYNIGDSMVTILL
jgi:hypothetical protein